MKKKIIITLAILYLILLLTQVRFAGPWNGKVVDMETKEPLAGAVVLVVWQRAYRTPAGDNTYFFKAKEVVTDKEGKFKVPFSLYANALPVISYIREPNFTIFKPGYLCIKDIHLDDYLTERSKKPLVELPENSKVFRLAPGIIELPQLKTREERIKLLPGSSDPFRNHYSKKKNYMRLLSIESKELGLQPEANPYE